MLRSLIYESTCRHTLILADFIRVSLQGIHKRTMNSDNIIPYSGPPLSPEQSSTSSQPFDYPSSSTGGPISEKDKQRRSSKSKSKEGKGRWLSQLKEWVSTSEPSTQALKQHKKDTFKKAGVSLDDPQATAKLHAPIGELPEDAIKPAGRGPDPEEVLLRRAEQRRKARGSYSGMSSGSRTSHSFSSGSSAPSLRKGSEQLDLPPVTRA